MTRDDGVQLDACVAIADDFAAPRRDEACIYAAHKLFAISEPVAQHEFQHALRGWFRRCGKTLQALLIRRRQRELRGSLTCWRILKVHGRLLKPAGFKL
jgi:hypothetical protein